MVESCHLIACLTNDSYKQTHFKIHIALSVTTERVNKLVDRFLEK